MTESSPEMTSELAFIRFVFFRLFSLGIYYIEHENQKTVLLNSVLDATFFGGMHDGLEHITCLLTETGDAVSSPHVARWFFQ